MHSCLTDTSFKTPSALASSAAAEAVAIGLSGIVCLAAGVCVQFKKIFGHFYLRFWLLWVFVLAVPQLNVVDSVVVNYGREGLDVTTISCLTGMGTHVGSVPGYSLHFHHN